MVAENKSNITRVTTIIKRPEKRWYAAYTQPRAEKKVYDRLVENGVETFLPLHKTLRQWSDRKKMVEVPLLSSYIFVFTEPREFPVVYRTTGVVKFVTFESQPVAIPEKQINNLRILINSNAEMEVTGEKFGAGDLVEVTTGPMAGLTGELIKVGSKKRFLVRIDKLEQNIVLTIAGSLLTKIKS